MRSIRLVSLVLLVACGSNNKATPDAHLIFDDSMAIDTPPPPPGCDYGELNDTGNDYAAMPTAGLAEQTNLGFTTQTVVCGKINNGHYDTSTMAVDIDSFLFTVSADSDVMATLVAPGAAALDQVSFYIYDNGAGATVFSGTFNGDHAVGIGHLAAGTYEIDMEAYGAADLAAPLDYKVKLVTDMPATRCVKSVLSPSFVEANDGVNNTNNDVISIDYNAPMGTPGTTLTPAGDAPEPTNLVLASGTNYRITGTHAAVAMVGSYLDRDTFKVKTGPTTNQLSVRLNWPGSTADLDFVIYPENSTNSVASGTAIGNSEDEFATFAVKPDTNYWLWAGMYTGSTAPVTYSTSVCAETFTP
jgi:hypothetical protein